MFYGRLLRNHLTSMGEANHLIAMTNQSCDINGETNYLILMRKSSDPISMENPILPYQWGKSISPWKYKCQSNHIPMRKNSHSISIRKINHAIQNSLTREPSHGLALDALHQGISERFEASNMDHMPTCSNLLTCVL